MATRVREQRALVVCGAVAWLAVGCFRITSHLRLRRWIPGDVELRTFGSAGAVRGLMVGRCLSNRLGPQQLGFGARHPALIRAHPRSSRDPGFASESAAPQ